MVHYHIKRCGPTPGGPARTGHGRGWQTTDINPTVLSDKLLSIQTQRSCSECGRPSKRWRKIGPDLSKFPSLRVVPSSVSSKTLLREPALTVGPTATIPSGSSIGRLSVTPGRLTESETFADEVCQQYHGPKYHRTPTPLCFTWNRPTRDQRQKNPI